MVECPWALLTQDTVVIHDKDNDKHGIIQHSGIQLAIVNPMHPYSNFRLRIIILCIVLHLGVYFIEI